VQAHHHVVGRNIGTAALPWMKANMWPALKHEGA
jgi:hypothetical protein